MVDGIRRWSLIERGEKQMSRSTKSRDATFKARVALEAVRRRRPEARLRVNMEFIPTR